MPRATKENTCSNLKIATEKQYLPNKITSFLLIHSNTYKQNQELQAHRDIHLMSMYIMQLEMKISIAESVAHNPDKYFINLKPTKASNSQTFRHKNTGIPGKLSS